MEGLQQTHSGLGIFVSSYISSMYTTYQYVHAQPEPLHMMAGAKCSQMCNWFSRKWPRLQLSSGFIYSSDEGADRLCSHLAISTVYSPFYHPRIAA